MLQLEDPASQPRFIANASAHLTDNTIHQADAEHKHDELRSVEAEARALRAGLTSADLEKCSSILNQLKSLSGAVPSGGRSSRRVLRVISIAIAQAQLKVEQLAIEEHRMHTDHIFNERFEGHVYAYMSAQSRLFYDSIDANATYTIAPVDQSGTLVAGEVQQVDGHKLRRVFSMIKYHSMDEQHKKEILEKTFGLDIKGEDKVRTPAMLKGEMEELKKLEEALRDMEAYKAFTILTKSARHLRKAVAEIEQNNIAFNESRRLLKEVMSKYEAVLKSPDDKVAEAALKFARQKLKTQLHDDVVQRILLEQPSGSSTQMLAISGGAHVPRGEHAIPGASPADSAAEARREVEPT